MIFFFCDLNFLKSEEVKIIKRIGDQIITNIDIENEYKYLISLNKQYQKLEKDKIFNFAKSSILKEKIKDFLCMHYYLGYIYSTSSIIRTG